MRRPTRQGARQAPAEARARDAARREAPVYRLRLDRIAWGGDAIAELPDGRVCFVSGGVPGDEVEVELTQDAKRFTRARLIRVISSSEERLNACPSADRCGGCRFQGYSYERELAWKTSALENMLQRIGRGIVWPELQTIAAPSVGGYRERVRVRVGPKGETGYLATASHAFVEATTCSILHPALEAARVIIGPWVAGLARVHQIRLEWDDVRRLVVVEVPADEGNWETLERVIRARLRERPLPALHYGEGMSAELALALRHRGRWVSLAGDAHVHRAFDRAQVVQRSGNFSQAHGVLNRRMRERVAELCDEGLRIDPAAADEPSVRPSVLDLYAGAGNLSFALSARGLAVTAVDHASEALAAGEAASLTLPRQLQVEQWLGVDLHEGPFDSLTSARDTAQAWVLDPPRGGISASFLAWLCEGSARTAVYVSCDPAAFARDVGVLAQHGWQVEVLEAWDMFPRTAHLELVARLRKLA